MSLKELCRRPEKLTGRHPAKQSQVKSPVCAVPKSARVRKTVGQYPTLRAALVKAIINTEAARNCSKVEAALRADDLAEATELALLTYSRTIFDGKLDKLRQELLTSEPNLVHSRTESQPKRQMLLVLVLSLILVPAAAVQQGLVSPRNMSWSELTRYCHGAITQASMFCQRADHWLQAKVR